MITYFSCFCLFALFCYAGIKFWRVGSRKIYAIKDSKKKHRLQDSSEDEGHKFPRLDSSFVDKLDVIDEKLSKILEVNPSLPLPLGVSSVLLDSLRCNICKASPINPPPIFVRCCKRILGCQSCVDEWYRGENGLQKKCPLCRGDRGFADTTIILGLDDLLDVVSRIMHVPPPPTQLPAVIEEA